MSSASRCGSGSTSRRPTPSAPAARRRPCCARGRAVTRSGSRTSRWTGARPSAGPSSSRSWPAMRAARPRIRARPATAPTGWRRSWRPRSGSGRRHVATGPLRAARASATAARSSPVAPMRPRISRTCWRACRSSVLARLRLPLGDATKAAVRAEAAAAGHGGGHRAREPGRLLPRRRRARRLPRARGRADWPRAASATRRGTSSGATRARSPTRRASAAASGVAAAAPLYVLRADAARNELVVGPQEPARLQRGAAARDAAATRARRACTPSCAARSPTVAARVEQVPGGLRLRLEEPVYGVAAGQTAALYDEAGCVVGSGVIAPAAPRS